MAENGLSPYGKTLLKALGGSEAMARATVAAVKRWGADRPDSVLEVIPREMAERALALNDAVFDHSEEELGKQAEVTRQDRRVRICFWEEYERAHREVSPMELDKIARFAGLPTWEGYWLRLQERPVLFAWLMSPPSAYKLQLKEGHEIGLARLVEIMQLPLMREKRAKDGSVTQEVDVGVGLLILQAFKALDTRLHGAVTQKTVHVGFDGGKVPEQGKISMDEVDKKIQALEQELEAATPAQLAPEETRVIDVESVPMERALDGEGTQSD